LQIRATYKYRIYPNHTQIAEFERTLNLCRELYNAALQERRDSYNTWKEANLGCQFANLENGITVIQMDVTKPNAPKPPPLNYYTQSNQLKAIKEARPEYKQIHSQILQDVLKRVDKAFAGFFDRVKKGQTPGYPRFQGKGRYDSFCFPQGGWRLTGTKLKLHGISGQVKVKLHREVLGKVKTCTIKREGKGQQTQWYVCFAVEYGLASASVSFNPQNPGGVDVGLHEFAAISTGEYIPNPRFFRKSEERLVALQVEASRKQKGSKRWQKLLGQLAKLHRKVKRQRSDFHHKQSRGLVDKFDLIVFEDLQVKNLLKRAKPVPDPNKVGQYLPNGAAAKSGLSKSISDAGWSTFVKLTTYKAASAGKVCLQIDPKNTSQCCSECGAVADEKLGLEDRTFECSKCGLVLDRDTNAARNIVKKGVVHAFGLKIEKLLSQGTG
jgi:putative transposase